MGHSSKSFGTLCFTLDSASVISKASRAIGDSHTFGFFIIQSTNFCLNILLTYFVWTMHGFIDHFISILWYWKIKFPRFLEAFFKRYELDLLHWSKPLIAWNLCWYVFFDGDETMGTIFDMKKVVLYSVCFCLLPIVARKNAFYFVHFR